MGQDLTKAKRQTKAEQEELLERARKHAVAKDKKAVTQAGFVDFSKSVEDQDHLDENLEDVRKEVLKFPTPCYNCDKQGNVQMCFSSIPFFKEIIIMAFVCDFCGYRNSEIKEGGGISDKAKKITFSLTEKADLNRDIFKSETAKFSLKEIGFDMDAGTLGSVYTTIEGLITKVVDSLRENNPFGQGDSATDKKFLEFLQTLEDYKSGKILPFTIELDDPAANCFIYNPIAPESDPKIIEEEYERTEEQNDDLGISHMNV